MGRDKKKKRYSSSSSSDYTDSESSSSESEGTSEEQRKTLKRKSIKEQHRRKSTDSHKHKKSKHKKKSMKHEVISDDDYFKKSSEFRSWLSNDRGIYFSDLSSSKSRKLFSKFVRKWNSNQLKKVYYKGIQSSSLEHSTQTDYKWKLTDHDDIQTGSVKDQVSSWTSRESFDEDDRVDRKKSVGSVMRGPQKPQYLNDPHRMEEEKESQHKLLQKSRKEFRKHHEMVMDELMPKATGRDAMIEKRKFMNQQRREREISPDINESTLMGASDKFKDKLKSKQEDREKRAQIASQKITDYKDKEKSKVAAILEMAKANKKEGSLW